VVGDGVEAVGVVTEVLVDGVGSPTGLIGTSSFACLFFLIIR